jgi:hypothetical protein
VTTKRNTVILNEYKSRSGASSGRHRSISIKSEPLVHTFDDAELGRGPAEAIRAKVEREIRGITEQVAPSTQAKRRAKGILGTKLFNATGRLASGLTVRQDGQTFSTVAPQGRLTGEAPGLVEKLLELVAIRPADLLKDKGVREAIAAGPGVIIRKGRRR